MRRSVLAALCISCVEALPARAQVTIEWVTVGDPGNAADTLVMNDGTTGYGSVGYTYRVGMALLGGLCFAIALAGLAVQRQSRAG